MIILSMIFSLTLLLLCVCSQEIYAQNNEMNKAMYICPLPHHKGGSVIF